MASRIEGQSPVGRMWWRRAGPPVRSPAWLASLARTILQRDRREGHERLPPEPGALRAGPRAQDGRVDRCRRDGRVRPHTRGAAGPGRRRPRRAVPPRRQSVPDPARVPPAVRALVMATVVAAGMTSHAPNMTATPDAAPAQRARFLAGLAEMRRRLRAARPDLVIMFVNDHVQNFFYDNLPAFCVGVGDRHWAPKGAATFLKIPQRQLPGAAAWGKALLAEGLEEGFDFAVSHDLEFWDDVSVPAHFLMPEGTLPILPVLTNCVAPPLPTPRRSWALGGFVRRFIDARPGGERVAVVATGGISHWIGVPNTGHINPEWDRRVLDAIAEGRGE
ncbi:MAG: hypothetical protein EHM88_14475, partial [Candidatus Rokuibacteriota bacterium]